MSDFNIDYQKRGGAINQEIQQQMNDLYFEDSFTKFKNEMKRNNPGRNVSSNELSNIWNNQLTDQQKDQYTSNSVQLYGGKLFDPRGAANKLGVVAGEDDRQGLLYTRKCHTGTDSYDLTCLEDKSIMEDLDDLVDDINISNIDYDPAKEKNQTMNEYTIFDTSAGDSVKGNFTETLLSFNYMSKINVDAIQDMIRYKIYKQTSKYIDRQSYNQLFIIMRSILLQYGDMSITDNNRIIKHINYLNGLVLDYCVKNILSSMNNYNNYINKANTIPLPHDNPENTQYSSRSDAQNYRAVDIDPLSYYPGYDRSNPNNNLRTSIIDYTRHEQ